MAEPIEYRPTRLLRAAAFACLLVFAGFLAIELLVGGPRPWVAAATLGAVAQRTGAAVVRGRSELPCATLPPGGRRTCSGSG